MDWRPVASSAIRRVGYDPARRELGVEFTSGELYAYAGVTEALFDAFVRADSKGRFFREQVLGRYPFRRLRA